MRVEKDFKEFIELLNKNKVQYLIIGGFAFGFYAEPPLPSSAFYSA